MTVLVRALVLTYRYVLRPLWPGGPPVGTRQCKFEPTCSQYAVDAVREHGALRGTALAVRRVGRCHPWSYGGYDPVRPR